ncbi:MAG: hypothetical protein MRK02_04310 [Candidatus Scalindua sp.]|nr:hypothetical protein [Candidatus Scalindua sp.]
MKYFTLFIALLMQLLISGLSVNGGVLPGISGMVRISEDTFLIIHDRKNTLEPGPRLDLLTITRDDGIFCNPLSVDDWLDEDQEPNDLEACCSIPGRPYEFLLAESGCYRNKFGRVFHIRLTKSEGSVWTVEVIQVFRIYHQKCDDEGNTYEGDQVEGIACFRAYGKTILVYGERGGKTEKSTKPGRIIWGELNLNKDDPFVLLGDNVLAASSLLGARDCSDLFLKQGHDSHIVWSVAVIDNGDRGPFKSVIYEAGSFVLSSKEGKIEFVLNPEPDIIWQLDGLKVEALAAPAGSVTQSVISIGTDDEDYGGIWRPLFERN